jgi:hypothetical protein
MNLALRASVKEAGFSMPSQIAAAWQWKPGGFRSEVKQAGRGCRYRPSLATGVQRGTEKAKNEKELFGTSADFV